MENICNYNFNTLIMGETGVGKSVITMDFLNNLDASNYMFKSSNFSAKTTSKNIYDLFKANIFKNGNFPQLFLRYHIQAVVFLQAHNLLD